MSSRITSGMGKEQVRGPDHHLNGLVRVPEHGDGSQARQRFLATGKGARLAIGLERGDDFLGHLLEVGYLVESDGVPDTDQANLVGGHVVEEVGHGCRPRQQDRIGADFLIGVDFAGPTRPEFHQVIVGLTQRQETGQKEQLQPALKCTGSRPILRSSRSIHSLVSNARRHVQ